MSDDTLLPASIRSLASPMLLFLGFLPPFQLVVLFPAVCPICAPMRTARFIAASFLLLFSLRLSHVPCMCVVRCVSLLGASPSSPGNNFSSRARAVLVGIPMPLVKDWIPSSLPLRGRWANPLAVYRPEVSLQRAE